MAQYSFAVKDDWTEQVKQDWEDLEFSDKLGWIKSHSINRFRKLVFLITQYFQLMNGAKSLTHIVLSTLNMKNKKNGQCSLKIYGPDLKCKKIITTAVYV